MINILKIWYLSQYLEKFDPSVIFSIFNVHTLQYVQCICWHIALIEKWYTWKLVNFQESIFLILNWNNVSGEREKERERERERERVF